VRGTRAADWITSGLILVAIGVALGALNSVLAGVMWWFASCGIAAAVLIAAAIVRSLARNPLWGTLAAFLAGVFSITLLFAPESAILGFIPTVDTIAALRVLEQAGYSSIANQGIPADAVQGILYLICLGVAAIALAMDTFAFTFKTRALTGIPLLVLLLVPSFVVTSINDALYFALTAFAWLAILVVPTRATDRRAALAVAGISVVLALVIPAALPPTRSDAADGANGPAAVVTGVNPIITLGKDLRQGSKTLALTYTTTEPGGEYLRLATLDDFNGASWLPAVDAPTPGNDVAKIGPVPGLGAGIRVTDVTSDITVASILTRWLPVPYAARSITGLQGNWGWEPAGLSVSSDISSAQGQKYEVKSVQPTPAVDELNAAGTIVEPGFERYLALPLGLPPVVADRARQVVGNATTNYQKAVALQKYFTGGAFTYSEQAPVQKGYDGSGAAVLAAFLAEKSGYCVHFSSAMAAMARTLGIPARVVVGFIPGLAVATDTAGAPASVDATTVRYTVTTHDLHAWPELYFAGIGWVRFEPTPGRGFAPSFALLAVDNPNTPNVDESVPSSASIAPTPVPTSTANPNALPDQQDQQVGLKDVTVQAPSRLYLFVPLLLVLAVPFAIRTLRRARRLREVEGGSARDAWDEIRDRAQDLGMSTADSRTPRQLSADLLPRLDDAGRAALNRLRESLEAEVFSDFSGRPEPDDVRVVSRSLARTVSLRWRLAAVVLPWSLVARWIPQRQTVE
jgi:transglutaminase-like putative cysteine protease